MQHMNSDRDDSDIRTDTSTAPTSPAAFQSHGNLNRLLEAMNLSPTIPGTGDISPAPSTSFSHLIKSVCRTDIQAYEDFLAFLHQSKSSKPPSRAVSGSYAGLNVMGLASLASNYASPQHQYRSSAPATSAANSSPSGASTPRNSMSFTPLRETKFYKRVLTEDIEPTLRLDIAPGISWLTKRSLISSICDGGLVIEPMTAVAVQYSPPCALCGEKRTGSEHVRTHRFRTSDNDSAQRHPLCILCLEKMRSCCDFVGYLRLIVDGHVRIGDEEDEKEAWEETVRLRERMFWSRIGGGVIPAFIPTDPSEKDSSAQSLHSPLPKKSYGSLKPGSQSCVVQNNEENKVTENQGSSEDPFISHAKKASIGGTIITREQSPQPENSASSASNDNGSKAADVDDNKPLVSEKTTTPLSLNLNPSPPPTTLKGANGSEPRLKVKIPTVFLNSN